MAGATRLHADARGGDTWRVNGWQVKGAWVRGPWRDYWRSNANALRPSSFYTHPLTRLNRMDIEYTRLSVKTKS